jgi:hypothetical protein
MDFLWVAHMAECVLVWEFNGLLTACQAIVKLSGWQLNRLAI